MQEVSDLASPRLRGLGVGGFFRVTSPRLAIVGAPAPTMAPVAAGRHGDIFPLPGPTPVEAIPRFGLGRRARQRVDRRRAWQGAACECVGALNCTAEGTAALAASHFLSSSPPAPVQEEVLARVYKATERRPLAGPEYLPEAALRSLLQADSRYDEGSAGGLAPYVTGKVSLPAGQGRATPLADVLSGEALLDTQNFQERMLLGPEELEAVLESGTPNTYLDPVFRFSPSKYAEFVAELYRAGVVRFAASCKITNGMFFVLKKNGKLRLILDARMANAHFRKAPGGNNASAACFGELRVPRGKKLWSSQYDVRDFFYRLGISPELSEYFGLPGVSRAKLAELLGEEALAHLPADLDVVVPQICVLPMGFFMGVLSGSGGAAYLCQESSTQCAVSLRVPPRA